MLGIPLTIADGDTLTAVGGIFVPTSQTNASKVGDVIENKQPVATNAAATTTYLQLCAILLPIGTWDVTAVAELASNGATFATVNADMAVSLVSAANTGSTIGYDRLRIPSLILGATGIESGAIPRSKMVITAPTTVYLNVVATYTLGTPQWTGSISACRIR